MSLSDWKQQQPESALIISLGRSPLEELVKTGYEEPILAAVITYQDFREIVTQESAQNSLSAIFYDPDPLRQLILGKLLLPFSDAVGVMHSMETPFFIEEYQAITETLGLSLNAIPLKQTTEVAIQFPRLVQKADFIIAQPDSVIYNSQTLPRVLLTSYRQRKVVIGYSTGIVKAGAVATTYTTAEMLIDDLEESALEILSNKKDSFTRHSKYYDISYNLEVANSLGLDIISKEELQTKIAELYLEPLNETNSQ
ncbi:ABC transporter substrate-binding protein [Kangiella koreensis]|nr:ABC transporter substrate binding protein [Kangiella koreensis]